jgi:hypothetical protein
MAGRATGADIHQQQRRTAQARSSWPDLYRRLGNQVDEMVKRKGLDQTMKRMLVIIGEVKYAGLKIILGYCVAVPYTCPL